VVLAFYRCQGHAGEGWPGGNGGVNVFNAIEDGEVKGRVKEGVLMVGSVKARGSHLRRGARRPGTARFSGGVAGVSQRRVGDVADSQGPLDREMRENATSSEGMNQKGKRISAEMPSTH
jgi:hypothetical protein